MPGFAGVARSNRDNRYGWTHQKERRRLKPLVDRGDGWCQQGVPGNGSSGTCLMSSRWIEPSAAWVLGHNDDGTRYIGPVHARCNTHDAARRGALLRNSQQRACTQCGTPFKPRVAEQTRCSDACRKAAHPTSSRGCRDCGTSLAQPVGKRIRCQSCARLSQRRQNQEWQRTHRRSGVGGAGTPMARDLPLW